MYCGNSGFAFEGEDLIDGIRTGGKGRNKGTKIHSGQTELGRHFILTNSVLDVDVIGNTNFHRKDL